MVPMVTQQLSLGVQVLCSIRPPQMPSLLSTETTNRLISSQAWSLKITQPHKRSKLIERPVKVTIWLNAEMQVTR